MKNSCEEPKHDTATALAVEAQHKDAAPLTRARRPGPNHLDVIGEHALNHRVRTIVCARRGRVG